MNLLKTNPIGIDAIIHELQKSMYTLATFWGIEMDGYPRCYILNKESGQTVEAFIGDKEYSKPLSFAEGNKFFFVAPNDIEYVSPKYFKTNIELYFILNTTDIKPNILHRADEEVRNDVINLIEKNTSVKIVRILWQIDKVFNRFRNKQSRSYDYDTATDLHPYHAFKIELELLPYNINKQICNN